MAETPAAKPGHNNGIDGDFLKTQIASIEALELEKKGIADDQKAVYEGLKHKGYDVKAIRKLIAYRSRDPEDVKKERETIDNYAFATGTGILE